MYLLQDSSLAQWVVFVSLGLFLPVLSSQGKYKPKIVSVTEQAQIYFGCLPTEGVRGRLWGMLM